MRPVVAQRLLPGAQRRLRARPPAPPRRRAGARRCARSSSRASRTAARRSPARWRSAGGDRDRVRAALEAIGLPADARAETLLARPVARARTTRRYDAALALAPGKVNLSLFVGAPRDDGLHPLVSVVQPVSLADELTLEPADRRRGGLPRRRRATNLAARALAALPRGDRLGRAAAAAHDRQARPGRRRDGRRLGDAAAALRLAAHAAGGADDGAAARARRGLGGDVPAPGRPGRTLMTGAGERVARAARPRSRSAS